MATVMRTWHDEIRARCFFDITCVLHDRCFKMVENNIFVLNKVTYDSCNTDMKTNMDAITSQIRKDGKGYYSECRGRAEMIKLAVDAANACKSKSNQWSCQLGRLSNSLRKSWGFGSFFYEFTDLLGKLMREIGVKPSLNLEDLLSDITKIITSDDKLRCAYGLALGSMKNDVDDKDDCH